MTTETATARKRTRRPAAETRVSPGNIARAGLVLIGLWAIANAIWIARNVFFLAFLATLFAVLFSVVGWPLRRAGMRRVLSVVSAVVFLLGLLALSGWLLWPAIQSEVPRFREAIVPALDTVLSWFESQYAALTGQTSTELMNGQRTSMREGLSSLVSGAWPVLSTSMGAISGLVIAVFAGAYFAAEPSLYANGLVRLAPEAVRPRIRSALHDVADTLRHWLLATLFNMLSVGILTTAGLLIIGIPAAVPLGVLAGIGEFVPYFGPIVTALPAIAAGFVISPGHALSVFLLILILQQIQGNLITPLIMKKVVHLPPALTVLVQSLMAVLFGVLGLLLAVPALATAIVIVKETYVARLEHD